MNRIVWIAVALVALTAVPGAYASHAPAASRPGTGWDGVIALVQSPTWVTEGSAITVSIEIADASEVSNASYTFCELTAAQCYVPPIEMTSNGSGWFVGTSKPMAQYPGMLVGISAGYNISVWWKNGTNFSEPGGPTSHFEGVTVAQSIVHENLFEVTVRNAVYSVTGQVTDQATGGAVAGANVTLSGTGTNYTTSSSSGAYSFSNLLNGTYHLSVTKSGFHMNPETVKVQGKSTVENAALTNASVPLPAPAKPAPTLLGLPQTEAYELFGGIAAVIVIAAALVLMMRRQRPMTPVRAAPAASEPSPAAGPK